MTGCQPDQPELDDIDFINSERADVLAPEVMADTFLDIKAERHSIEMADAGKIFHSPNLADGLPQGWKGAAENVGMGGSLEDIERALTQSPAHYEAMIDPDYNRVGVGVVERDGIFYVTQIFVEI